MTVIQFPTQTNPQTVTPEPETWSTIDTAEAVHRMILNGLRLEPFREHPEALSSVLVVALTKHFGPDFVHWAEQQFQLVYGCDPYSFVRHLTSYRT